MGNTCSTSKAVSAADPLLPATTDATDAKQPPSLPEAEETKDPTNLESTRARIQVLLEQSSYAVRYLEKLDDNGSHRDAISRYEEIHRRAQEVMRRIRVVHVAGLAYETSQALRKAAKTIFDGDKILKGAPVIQGVLATPAAPLSDDGGVPPLSSDLAQFLKDRGGEMSLDDFSRSGGMRETLSDVLTSPENLKAFPVNCRLLTAAFRLAAVKADRRLDPAVCEVYSRLSSIAGPFPSEDEKDTARDTRELIASLAKL